MGNGGEGREFRPQAAGRARAGPVSTRGLGGGVAATTGPGARPYPRVPAAGPGGRGPPPARPRWSLVTALPMQAEPLPCRTPPPALTGKRGQAVTQRSPAHQGRRARGRGWAGVPARVCDVTTPTRPSARPRLLPLKPWTHHGGAQSAAWRALPRVGVKGRTF